MGLVSSAAYYQRFVESKLDRHGILYRKVSATATDEDVYIDSDGMNRATAFRVHTNIQ
eukprot:SAG31_NODE_1630_length_7699_cov_36.170921_3_plen_58_part_00